MSTDQVLPGNVVWPLRAFGRSFLDNPVLAHELRARMRGARAAWIILGYLVSIAGMMGLVVFTDHNVREGIRSPEPLGPNIFAAIVLLQAVLISLIAPALTCGAITLERERQSYEMLAVTRMNAHTLVWGKLISSLSFLLLCLAASLPLVLAAAAFGGLSPGDVLGAYLLLALEAGIFGAFGLFWSAAVRSTITATALVYPSVALASFVTMFFGSLVVPDLWPRDWPGLNDPGFWILGGLSPFVAGFAMPGGLPFFGICIPFWAPGAVFGPLIIALCCSLAAGRLKSVSRPSRNWTFSLATALLGVFTLALTGGFLGPGVDLLRSWNKAPLQDHLWIAILLVLAGAVPFVAANPFPVVARDTPSARTRPRSPVLSGLARVGLWLAICSGILAAGIVMAPPLPPEFIPVHAPPLLQSLFFLTSFVLLEAALTMALARLLPRWGLAIAASLVVAGALLLWPLIVQTLVPDDLPPWSTAFLSTFSYGPHVRVTPAPLYLAGAVAILLLALMPGDRRGARTARKLVAG